MTYFVIYPKITRREQCSSITGMKVPSFMTIIYFPTVYYQKVLQETPHYGTWVSIIHHLPLARHPKKFPLYLYNVWTSNKIRL